MGKRLKVAQTYKIVYAEKEAFNWMINEVKDMLNALGIDYYDLNHELTDGYGDMFEVDKEEFLEGITKLKEMDDTDIPEEVKEVMEQCGISKEGLYNHLKEYHDLSDDRNGYMLFNFI